MRRSDQFGKRLIVNEKQAVSELTLDDVGRRPYSRDELVKTVHFFTYHTAGALWTSLHLFCFFRGGVAASVVRVVVLAA